MIKEGEIYEVYDSSGRQWGKVQFKWPQEETIAGYLEATPEFNEISLLFKKHDELMSQTNSIDSEIEESSKTIASLGVVLVNIDTGEKKNVDPVFVSDKLLFTCDVNS